MLNFCRSTSIQLRSRCASARQFAREVGLPHFNGLACSHGRRQAPLQESAERLVAGQSLFRQHGDTIKDDVVIGAAGAESIEAQRRICLQFGSKAGDLGEHRIGFVTRVLLHALGDGGEAVLDLADLGESVCASGKPIIASVR